MNILKTLKNTLSKFPKLFVEDKYDWLKCNIPAANDFDFLKGISAL